MTREEAIRWLEVERSIIVEVPNKPKGVRELRKAIDMAIEALSADAVQGEWIDKEIPCNPYPPVFCVECSECGYRVGRETFQENTFNYCPNCGARMKGGEDE